MRLLLLLLPLGLFADIVLLDCGDNLGRKLNTLKIDTVTKTVAFGEKEYKYEELEEEIIWGGEGLITNFSLDRISLELTIGDKYGLKDVYDCILLDNKF